MELSGQQLLAAPRDRVWSALTDPETLRAAIPGCEYVTAEGDGVYTIGMLATVGAVQARFKGRMQQQDVQPPHRCTLSFEGDGGLAGFARGSAEVELLESGESRDATRLQYRAQAQVGGRVAQIGARLVDATAARMSAQFFERLDRAIAAPAAAAPAPAGALAALAAADAPAALAAAGPPAARDAASAAPAATNTPSPSIGVSLSRGMVTVQLPAWAFAFAIAALVALIGWLAAH